MLQGKFIGVNENVTSFVLEYKFSVNKPSVAVLRATALGLYYAKINGVRVGDFYLTPGWTSYKKTLQVQEYDISTILKEGENVISFTVGEGWYKGPISWARKTNLYGDKIAICADLILDKRIISTDTTWTAKTSSIVNNGIYDGEEVDFTCLEHSLSTQEISFDKSALIGQICEPIRTIERLAAQSVVKLADGTIYDFGQNISGVVEIVTPTDFEGTVTMRYAELIIDGDIYTGNLGNAKATDKLTCKGSCVYAPEFTFHGFRYVKVEGIDLSKDSVTALVRHTDMKRTGTITTSNVRVNRLISNIIWGQRDNFVDIPSDCPQRSERLGWTGDINAFLTTAAFNYDIRAFMKKWLIDCRNDQYENGEMPHIVPNVTGIMPEDIPESTTSAMWADCIVNIPYKLYLMYGDKSYLQDNYVAIKKFINAHDKYMENGLLNKGFEYGDWLALDGQALCGTETSGGTDKYFVANVLYIGTLETAEKIADILQEKEDVKKYAFLRGELLKKVRNEYFTSSGRLAFETLTAQAIALYFNVVPEEFRKELAMALNESVKKYNYRMITGFVGTPYLLFALADNGYAETAGKILLNNGYPGWLYEVDVGATTVWERWNTLLPDGKPNTNGMNSCNHYAYGSVLEYVYRRICGIEPLTEGFKRVKISPMPCKGISYIRAEYDSANGKIIAGYEQKDGKIKFLAEIPKGMMAEIYLPNEGLVKTGNGLIVFEREWENLEILPFTEESTMPEILSNPKANKAFMSVFGNLLHPLEIEFVKGNPYSLQFLLNYMTGKGRIQKEMQLELVEDLNRRFLQ